MDNKMDYLDHGLQQVLESSNDANGFDIRVLDPGTKINVETRNSVYQITVVYKSEIMIMGGMKHCGEIRFPIATPAAFIGSVWPDLNLLKSCWVGEQMMMELFMEQGGMVRTSPVINVEIEAQDDSWSYSLEWNK